MNRKCKLITAMLCLFTIMAAYAQVATTADAKIKGTPYLQDAYEEGVIHYANNKMKVPARYNAFQDLIEYQQGGRAMVLDPTPTIKKVQLHNAIFVVEKYSVKGKSKLGYFALLDSGKVMLYSKKRINYLEPKKGKAMDGGDLPAEYRKMADIFYYKIGNTGLQEVTNIKSMIASFPDKQDELTRFAKEEKISHRDEEEVLRLVKYYNSLE